MSLSAGSRAHSPMSSGRSSPQPRRRPDEDPTKKDPKYKRFSTSIDRALALFESNNLQEWADYISFLGRLLKALQSHPSLPLIPSKVIVAQRLAQCLNPRLPSGVHQKTIEVYSYIFSKIGRDGLSADLALWTPGLTPVLSYASLTLKPHYLDLLEIFYLPVGTALRPALRSLILALLPGIDEEGGEYFDKTLALIDAIRKEVQDDAYFWQCVLLATITAPARRQGALAFLGRRLPRLDFKPRNGDDDGKTEEERKAEVYALIHPEPGLLVRAFCAGLGDEQILVQRGFLDLLVTDIQISSPIVQEKVSKADIELLVSSAAGVVMRRDMSLNRRLWAWFLGPDEANSQEYFERYGLDALVQGLLKMLHTTDATPIERARPYRISLSLMDRWEVGSLVAPKLFLPAIESLRSYEHTASKEAYTEVFRSASMFFDGVEAGLIWGQMLDEIQAAFTKSDAKAIERLQLVRFIIRTFNVREEEMVLVHAPIIVLVILKFLSAESQNENLSPELWKQAFLLAEEIWDLVPAVALKPSTTLLDDKPNELVLDRIHRFYKRDPVRSSNGTRDVAPFPLLQVAEWVFKEIAVTVQKSLDKNTNDVGIRCRLFVNIARKVPKVTDWPKLDNLVSSFLSKLQLDPVPFDALRGMANMVATMYSKGYLDHKYTDELVVSVTTRLWFYLSPDAPKFHVEAVRALWNLQTALNDRRVEVAVSTVMTSSGSIGAEPGRNFAVLWMHSVGGLAGNAYNMVLTRPLFLFLDSLMDDGTEMSVFARGWLQTLPSIPKLFWIFVEKLLSFRFLRDPGPRDADGAPQKRSVFEEDDCLEIATYYFQTLLNVLRYATPNMLAQLAGEMMVNGDDAKAAMLREYGYGNEDMTLQMFFVKVSIRAMDGDSLDSATAQRVSTLHKMSLGVLHQILLSPYSKALADMELENLLTARLISIINTKETYVQVSLLDVLHAALKLSLKRPTSQLGQLRLASRTPDPTKVSGPRSSSLSAEQEKAAPPPQFSPPQQLLKCLIGGFSSVSSRPVLDSWIFFLGECLPLVSEVIFQMLIPLVECLCNQIKITFESLKSVFRETERLHVPESGGKSPESTLVALLNGLEQILAAAHDRLLAEELKNVGPKNPEAASSGFFGNMVSGVFAAESPQSRSATANNRLTVLLCFQDTVKICYSIWSWADVNANSSLDSDSKESWGYTSLRMKGRARRILEHMFAAETLECLETLIELWPGRTAPFGDRKVGSIFRLVNVLDGSRPKHTIPAIFNAIYSRTNPAALEPSRRSTLTADLSDIDVVIFLVEYARSLEDDAMDEIWTDCMVFLRDVLANPFPHRQILPSLLSFTATLGEKVDNTNFGEQKRMRKELGDLFLRLLTAVFTVAPAGFRVLEPISSTSSQSEKSDPDGESRPERPNKGRTSPDDIIPILVSIVPELRKVVVEPDKVITASISISTSLVGPTFRAKSFPQNVTPSLLDLIYQLTRLQNNQKAWKKELSDVFLDPKFFNSTINLIKEKWIPLLRQYLLADRDRMMELLSRLTPPTTAGVLFGVGAASARQEADRKTALNLKRISFLIFAAEQDSVVPKLTELEEKLVELLSATAVSSPSSATRGEIYLVLRALALRTSPVHMSSLWPLINSELTSALLALTIDGDPEKTYTDTSILHACKLLDTLLVIAPDEFQLHEWLFITDTIEAVYHNHEWNPAALVDQVAIEMSYPGSNRKGIPDDLHHSGRKPWFKGGSISEDLDIRRDLIAPFMRNLSIVTYEGTYAMGKPDYGGVEDALLADLFEETGQV